MPSDTPADAVPEPKSPGPPTDNAPVRAYLTIAKLTASLLVFILTLVSALLWPLHLHPVFLATLFTCFTTFTILTYSHVYAQSSPAHRLHGVVSFLFLHALPFVLWVVTLALAALWTHRYHTTSWRTGSPLDAQKTYLAELPPGLTPAKIAADHLRHRTLKYTAAVRMTGVCAGLAGLTATLFAVSGVEFVRNVRQRACPEGLAQGQTPGLPGRGWWAALVSRVRRKETLPVTETQVKVIQAGSSVPEGRAGESGSSGR